MIRVFLLIMIVTAISLPYTIAADFSIKFPKEVLQDQEFEVTISAKTNDVHDVKIYIHKDVKEFSEIYDGESWESSRFYIWNAFPNQKIFKVKSHYQGKSQLCVQLRKSGQTSFDKICEEIMIGPPSVKPSLQPEKPVQETQDEIAFINLSQERVSDISIEETNSERKVLSKEGKERRFIMYLFIILMIFIPLIAFLKKLNF